MYGGFSGWYLALTCAVGITSYALILGVNALFWPCVVLWLLVPIVALGEIIWDEWRD